MASSTSSAYITFISKCSVFPEAGDSTINTKLKLSVSDLPMLSCHYIQKGLLFSSPPFTTEALLHILKTGLARTLTFFPALSGRLITDSDGFVYVSNSIDETEAPGVDFVHARVRHVSITQILSRDDLPDFIKLFFPFDGAVSYDGHFKPITAVQVTELDDGVFIGCAANHAVMDGTSFWNFFNSFAEMCRRAPAISNPPDFRRSFVKDSQAVLRFQDGNPTVTFDVNAPLRERIFHFSKEAIQQLKARANSYVHRKESSISETAEIMGKLSNDDIHQYWANKVNAQEAKKVEISSFQSLSAQLWRSVTRARKLEPEKTTTFRMAVNCRHRVKPPVDPYYFGNAIQSVPTYASARELLSKDLYWSANLLRESIVAHDDAAVRRMVENWEKNPRCFPLGNFDGAMITMGSSPRFPMYDNDFGWGRPLAVRSGRANKFDGKISAFPAREGDGSVDLEVCFAPETMEGLEKDVEFMQYVTTKRS